LRDIAVEGSRPEARSERLAVATHRGWAAPELPFCARSHTRARWFARVLASRAHSLPGLL